MKTRKFTLIELLIVMLIISILASMMLPTLNKAREKARKIASSNNLKQIGTAMFAYTIDNESKFPYGAGNATGIVAGSLYGLKLELKNPNIFMDLSSGKTASIKWSAGMNCDFVYAQYATGTTAWNEQNLSPDSGLVANKIGTHVDFGNVLFADGHVVGFSGFDWNSNTNIKNPALQALTQ